MPFEQPHLSAIGLTTSTMCDLMDMVKCYVPVKSKLQHPPGHLNFWKISAQIPPPRAK